VREGIELNSISKISLFGNDKAGKQIILFCALLLWLLLVSSQSGHSDNEEAGAFIGA
jgi:hypothetical protein